jgi:hypothetical protein
MLWAWFCRAPNPRPRHTSNTAGSSGELKAACKQLPGCYLIFLCLCMKGTDAASVQPTASVCRTHCLLPINEEPPPQLCISHAVHDMRFPIPAQQSCCMLGQPAHCLVLRSRFPKRSAMSCGKDPGLQHSIPYAELWLNYMSTCDMPPCCCMPWAAC